MSQDYATGKWTVTRAVTSLHLPDSLHGLLLERIDQLSLEERRILQIAAVIGPVFWLEPLQALAGELIPLSTHLAALQRVQLIQERGKVPFLGMQYKFRSSLIRDVAYEGLLSNQREAYHLKIAEYLEEKTKKAGVLSQYYGILAYHYHKTQIVDKGLFYTLQAAEQAKRIYANTEAIERYTQALQLLDECETVASKEKDSLGESQAYAIRKQRFEVLNERREIYYLLGQDDSGRADAQAMLQLARKLDKDPACLIDALLQQITVAEWWQGKETLGPGIPLAEEALTLSRRQGDLRREMQSLVAIAHQRLVFEDPSWQEIGEHALQLSRQLGDRDYEVRLLLFLGSTYSWSNQPQRGIEYLTAALPLCQELGNTRAEVGLLDLVGLQLERTGDYYHLLKDYQEKRLAKSREIGYFWGELEALIACGQIQSIYLGDYEGGMILLEEAWRHIKGSRHELYASLRIIQVLVAQGRFTEALEIQETIYRLGEHSLFYIIRVGLRIVHAILLNALGDENHLRQALEFTRQADQLMDLNPLISHQYAIATACQASKAYLQLARCASEADEQIACLQKALQSS